MLLLICAFKIYSQMRLLLRGFCKPSDQMPRQGLGCLGHGARGCQGFRVPSVNTVHAAITRLAVLCT